MTARRGAIALTLVALVVAGCGSKSTGAQSQTPAQTRALQLLTPQDLASTPVDSPARTVLEWWRYLQFRDPKDALDQFSPAVRADVIAKGAYDLVERDIGPWLTTIRPKILDTENSGDTATVFLRVMINTPVGTDIVKQAEDSLALPLARVNGKWLISDATFFLSQGAILRANRLQAEAAAAKRNQ